MSSEPIVHVIDDDDAVRESVSFVLDSAGLRARAYGSAEAFLAGLGEVSHGCVVTDVRMPAMNGIELIRELQSRGSTLPVIVMTGHADVQMAIEAMRAGVIDFLEKPFDDEVLLGAVTSAMNRGQTLEKDEAERQRFHALLETLSPRETEVLRGVVAGHSNKVIGRDLDISHRTVEVYRANVMSKTNAATLSDLVRIAILAKF
jgi:two-component system response regulator FixJ